MKAIYNKEVERNINEYHQLIDNTDDLELKRKYGEMLSKFLQTQIPISYELSKEELKGWRFLRKN